MVFHRFSIDFPQVSYGFFYGIYIEISDLVFQKLPLRPGSNVAGKWPAQTIDFNVITGH